MKYLKHFLLTVVLLFCIPALGDEAKDETPEQKQAKIAQSTAKIADLKTQLRAVNAQVDPLAHQDVSEKLMQEYLYRALIYRQLEDWNNSKADIVEADQARRNLFYGKYKDSIEREAEFYAMQAECNLHLGNLDGALRRINDARGAKGWDRRISSDSLVGAKVNLILNRPDAALADALDAQQRTKTPRDALVALSLAYYQKGDLEKATAAWAEVLKVHKKYEVVKLFDPSIAPLNAAIAQNPNDAKAWFRRGIAYQNGGDAYGRYNRGGDDDGSWFCLPSNFASFASDNVFFWDAAQRDFSRSYALEKSPRALVQRAKCLYALSRVKEELKKGLFPPDSTWQADVKQALKTGYKDYDAMHSLSYFQATRALHLKAAGNIPASRSAQLEANYVGSLAVFHNPENPSAKTDKPVIARAADKLIEDTKGTGENEAWKLNQQVQTAEGWKELGNKANAAGNEFMALQYYKKALEMNPQYADAQNNIGSIYSSANDFPRANEAFLAAIKLDPQHRLAYFNLAANLRTMRFYDEALKYADSAVQFSLTPEQKTAALGMRSKIRFGLKDRAGALSDLHALLEAAPQQARAWQSVGTISLEDADFTTAQDAFQKCLAIKPQDSIVKVLLAMTINAAELAQVAQNKGKTIKELSYSDWEAICPASQELLKSATLTSTDKDDLSDYWNDMLRPSALSKTENKPAMVRCQSVMKTALGIQPLNFTGTAGG